jgi:hypothetical protein
MAFAFLKSSTSLKLASPFFVMAPVGFWAYNKRKTNLNHPVMQRAFLHLQNDQRVLDFCGENIKAGYWITVNEDPTDNYIKFGFTIKGQSGDLGASVIGDYLTHRELNILEQERVHYFDEREKIKSELTKYTRNKEKSEELTK